MGQNIWFTSDTHFGHANIIRYSGRSFDGIKEHDRGLIEAWNTVVQPRDLVYHLGDFSYKGEKTVEQLTKALHGQIYLIEGNHDAAAKASHKCFAHFAPVAKIRAGEHKLWLSHYAHRVWPGSHRGVWHLYGHSHNSLPDDPNALSFDVGVDAVAARLAEGGEPQAQDYRPMHLDEVATVMASKTYEPVDHHGRD